MAYFADRIVAGAARRTLATLTTRGLIREGLYVAAKTLFDDWRVPAGDALGTGFLEALSTVLDRDELETWHKLVELRAKSQREGTAILQLAAQAPHEYELVDLCERIAKGGYSQEMLSTEIVAAGNSLLKNEKYDAGMSVLAYSACSDLAGAGALTYVRDAIKKLPRRVARVPGHVESVAKDLTTAASRLASTGHYGAAVHMRCMVPLLTGNMPEFERIGRGMLNANRSRSIAASESPVEMSVELCLKGYRAQATEFVTAATGIAQGDQAGWKQVYEVIGDPDPTTSANKFMARMTAPAVAVAEFGLDLRPTAATKAGIALVGTDGVRAIRVESEQIPSPGKPPPRHVNAWLGDDESYPSDEFDVWANIGPPQQGAMGGKFDEPDWHGREHIDLRLVLSGLDAEIRPGWHIIRLPRIGKTEDVKFHLKSSVVGALQVWLRVYSANEMLLLDEHKLTINIEAERQAA